MADRKHLINVHTSTGLNEPSGASLYLGEIAVQHTSGSPALWIKMGSAETSADYEKFIGKTEITNLLEDSKILGSSYTYSGLPYVNSSTTIADAYSALTKEMIDDEKVTAAALNDLEDRIGSVETGLSGENVVLTGYEIACGSTEQELLIAEGDTANEAFGKIQKQMLDNEEAIAAGLNDLNARLDNVDDIIAHNTGITQLSGAVQSLSAGTNSIWSEFNYYTPTANTRSLSSATQTLSSATHNKITNLSGATQFIGKSTLTINLNGVEQGKYTPLSGNSTINLTAATEVTGADVLLTGYELSSGTTEEELTIVATDTVNEAFGKIQKQNYDNEVVVAGALNDLDARVQILEENSGSSQAIEQLESAVSSLTMEVNTMSGAVSSLTMEISAMSETVSALTESFNELDEDFGALSGRMDEVEYVMAAAVNDLNLKFRTFCGMTTDEFSTLADKIDVISASTAGGGSSADIGAVSGAVVSLSGATTGHVANNDIHVTSAQKTAWTNGSNSGASAYTAVTALSAATTAISTNVGKIAVTSVTINDTGNAVTDVSYSSSALTLTKGNVVTGVTMNSAAKTVTNGVVDLGTVITAQTQLSTATTGTGNVITDLTVSNHQITKNYGMTALSAITASGDSYLNATVEGNSKVKVSLKSVADDKNDITGATTTGSLVDAKAVKEYVEDILSSAVDYKGSTATVPTNPSKGDLWIATAAMTASTKPVEVGDFIIYNGSSWDVIQKNLDGAVTGTLTADTVTLGDSTNSVKSLANGTNGQLLGISSNKPAWLSATLDNVADGETRALSNYVWGNARIFAGTCPTAAGTSAKTVTCSAFTQEDLVRGALIFVTFDNTNSAAATALTMDVNETGAQPLKKQYSGATRNLTMPSELGANSTLLFQYDGTNWVCITLDYSQTNTNTNTIGIVLRYGQVQRVTTSAMYRYRLMFSSADNKYWVPANSASNTDATAARAVTTTPINPFGPIGVYMATGSTVSGASPATGTVYTQHSAVTLGYSFVFADSALTSKLPVYLKCEPQADGSAIIDATTPVVQELPTSEDGKIYIFLGVATSPTAFELYEQHPVYQYKNGHIRIYQEDTSAELTTLSSATQTIESNLSNLSGATTAMSANVAKIAVTSVTISNTGNAVTNATYSNSALTLTKGNVQATISDLDTIRARSNSGYSAYTGFIAHSADTGIHVTSTDKTNWTNGSNSGASAWTAVTALSAGTVSGLSGKENTSNKVTAMTSSSTDAQYPSAKAVYDAFDQNERTWGAAINTLNSTLTGHTGNTDMHLPAVTSSDNGKILMVTNGTWTLTPVATIYTGSTAPDSSLGNNGDIYLQS